MGSDDVQVLMEHFDSKFDSLAEAMQALRVEMATKTDLDEVKQDIKAIKAAVTDTNRQAQDHERRITHLEAAA